MRGALSVSLIGACILLVAEPAAPGPAPFVTVETKAPENREAKFYYRVPSGYKENSGKLHRVLVFFNGRNWPEKGQAVDASYPYAGFAEWADENDMFIVAPGYRNDDYWHPEKWSGKALVNALEEIGGKYGICQDRLLYFGHSAGSQCANLFAAWRPDMCVAWVSHGCGVWHRPTKKMNDCPGLASCGEADAGRYELSRRFVEESRRKGNYVLWRTWPNTPHETPPGAIDLAKAFLKYYHGQNLGDLEKGKKSPAGSSGGKSKKKAEVLFVGDDQESRYWPAGSREIEMIEPEDRVEFYSEEVARAWAAGK